jgi:hypothetical protein
MAAALCYNIAVIISRGNNFTFIPYWVVVAWNYNFYFKDLRNIKQNLIKIDHHIKNLCRYISVNKVPKGLKIKVTPQTPGIKTNNFYRRWDIILFERSTRLLKLLLDDASYQKKGFEKIVSDLLNTSEEQLSTDDYTNICRRLDEIQKLEDTRSNYFS